MTDIHVSRGWGRDPFAGQCVCEQLECWYVVPNPDCEQHGFHSAKTIRGMHLASECPANDRSNG